MRVHGITTSTEQAKEDMKNIGNFSSALPPRTEFKEKEVKA